LRGDDAFAIGRRERARRVAFLAQDEPADLPFTAREVALMGRAPHLGLWALESASDRARADEALAEMDASALADRSVAQLSGGERRRVYLARTFAQEAALLVLDEPTTALDIGRQQQVLELVARLREQRGLTVLSAMHDLTLAAQYADTLLLLSGGTLVAAGPPEQIATEELVAAHYGAEVQVLGEGRSVAVVPVRR
jgi:iron complex transport system ATP-binding protein